MLSGVLANRFGEGINLQLAVDGGYGCLSIKSSFVTNLLPSLEFWKLISKARNTNVLAPGWSGWRSYIMSVVLGQ